LRVVERLRQVEQRDARRSPRLGNRDALAHHDDPVPVAGELVPVIPSVERVPAPAELVDRALAA
jgi:hypothetical protein